MEVGIRVGALIDVTEETKRVRFLGYGVYEADEIPDEQAGGMAPLVRAMGRENPKIRLDNGDVVWGCECWWDKEEEFKSQIEKYKEDGYAIEEVKIQELRNASE